MKMFKMALFDCAINEKCCSVDGGQGHLPSFFVPTAGDLTAQESPCQGGGGGEGHWVQLELTDALQMTKYLFSP